MTLPKQFLMTMTRWEINMILSCLKTQVPGDRFPARYKPMRLRLIAKLEAL